MSPPQSRPPAEYQRGARAVKQILNVAPLRVSWANHGNREQADVSDVLIGLITAGQPGAVGDGVGGNDKNYLSEFPWLAAPYQGLNEGHGAPAQ